MTSNTKLYRAYAFMHAWFVAYVVINFVLLPWFPINTFEQAIIGVGVLLYWVPRIIWRVCKCKFFCKHFGWHKKPASFGFDGNPHLGLCPVCGTPVALGWDKKSWDISNA